MNRLERWWAVVASVAFSRVTSKIFLRCTTLVVLITHCFFMIVCHCNNFSRLPIEVTRNKIFPFLSTNEILKISDVTKSWRDQCKSELIERELPREKLRGLIDQMSKSLIKNTTISPELSERLNYNFHLNDFQNYLSLFMYNNDPRMQFDFFMRLRTDYKYPSDGFRPMRLRSIDLKYEYSTKLSAFRQWMSSTK